MGMPMGASGSVMAGGAAAMAMGAQQMNPYQ